jgi:tetratricopeptide (TPR) repeat protein
MLHALNRYRVLSIVRLLAVLSLTLVMTNALAIDEHQFVKDIQFAKDLAAKGGLKEAITFWEHKKPQYAGGQGQYENELGNFYSAAKEYGKAEQAYKDGVALHGKYPPLYIGLAISYADQGRFKEATDWASRATREYPSWWRGYYTLGEIDRRQEKYPEAKGYLQRSIQLQPMPATYWLLAIVGYELKEPRTTIAAMGSAIGLDKRYAGDEEGMEVMAVSLAQVGRYQDAYNALNTLKQNNPQVPPAQFNKAKQVIDRLAHQNHQ